MEWMEEDDVQWKGIEVDDSEQWHMKWGALSCRSLLRQDLLSSFFWALLNLREESVLDIFLCHKTGAFCCMLMTSYFFLNKNMALIYPPFSNHKVVPFCKYSETLIGFYYWPPSSGAHPTPHTNVKLLLAVSCSSGSDKVNHQQRDVCPWNRSCVVSGSEWIPSCLRSASTVSLQMANLNFAFSLRSVMSTVHSVAGTWWYFLPSSLLFLFLNKKQQMDVQAADEQWLTFLNQKDGFFYLYCRISKRYPTVWWFQPSFAVAG